MADQQPEQDNTLTKVARTAGSALGTVASVASEKTADKPDAGAGAPKKKNAAAVAAAERDRQKQKIKRLKHRRKLHRKTRG